MDGSVDPGSMPSGQARALAVPNYATYGRNLQPFPVSFEVSAEEWNKRMCATAASSQLGNVQPPALSVKTQAKGTRKRKLAIAETGRLPDIQPLDMRFDAQAEGKKKRKPAVAESGQLKSRWRAHNKATCLCAVCKQVRGELRSTWFNHDKVNCKCSVCKQARGEKSEKRTSKATGPAEQRLKPPSVSRRQQRLSGKLPVTTPQSSPILPPQPLVPGSGVPVGSGCTNPRPAEATMQTSNGFLAFPVPGYCWDRSGTFQIPAAPYHNSTTFFDIYNAGRLASSGVSPQTEVPSSSPSLTSPAKNSYLDRIMLSWKHNTSFSMSTSETLSQPPPHALPSQIPYHPADLAAHHNFSVNRPLPLGRRESRPQPPPHVLYSQSLCILPHLTAHTDNSHTHSSAVKRLETLSQPPFPAFDPQGLCSSAYMTAELNACRSDSFAVNGSETLAQPLPHALGSYGGWNSGDLRALSTTGHSTYKDSELNCSSSSRSVAQASVVQGCPSGLNGTILSPVVPRSEITCGFTQDIKNMETASNSSVVTVVQRGALNRHEESEASSQDQGVLGSQLDSEETSVGGTGELLVAVSEEALPCVAEKHNLESTSNEKGLDLALPLVPKMLPTSLRETSKISKKRKNRTCSSVSKTFECGGCMSGALSKRSRIMLPTYTTTLQRPRGLSHSMDTKRPLSRALHNTCGIASSENLRSPVIKKLSTVMVTRSLPLAEGCVYGSRSPATIRTCSNVSKTFECGGCMSGALSKRSRIMLPTTYTTTLQRRRVLSHSMDSKRPLSRALHNTCGIASSENLRSPVIKKLTTVMVTRSLRLAEGCVYGSRSPATIRDQTCYSSGSCISLAASNQVQDSSQLRIRTFSRYARKPLFCGPQNSSISASNSLTFFLNKARLQSRGTPERFTRDSYRILLRSVEEVSPGNLQVGPVGATKGSSAFDPSGHKRYGLLSQLYRMEISSQKSADIRIHRSQSALLLGEQPCSVLIVAHLQPALQCTAGTLGRGEGFTVFGVFHNVQLITDLLYSGSGGSSCHSIEGSFDGTQGEICRSRYRLEDSFDGSQGGTPTLVFLQLLFPKTGSGRPVFHLKRLVTIFQKNQGFEKGCHRQLLSSVFSVGYDASSSFPFARKRERLRSSWPVVPKANSDFSVFDQSILVTLLQSNQGVEETMQRRLPNPLCAVGSGVSRSFPVGSGRERVISSWPGAASVNSDFSVFSADVLAPLLGSNRALGETSRRQFHSLLFVGGSSDARRRERVSSNWPGAGDFSFFGVNVLVESFGKKEAAEINFQTHWLSPVCGIGSVAACSSSAARRKERVSLPGADVVNLDFSDSDLKRQARLYQRNQGVKQNFHLRHFSPVCAVASSASCRPLVARRRERVISSGPGATKVSSEFSADKEIIPIEVPQPDSVERFTALVQSVIVMEQRSGDNRKHDNLDFVGPAEPPVKKRRLSRSRCDFSAVTAVVCRWAPGISHLGSARAVVGSPGHKVFLRSVSRLRRKLFSNEGVDPPSDNDENWSTRAQRSDEKFSQHHEETDGEKMYLQSRISEYSPRTQKSVTLCQIKAERPSSGEVRQKEELQLCRTEGNWLPSGFSFQEFLSYVSKDVHVKSEMIPSIVELESAQTSNTKENAGRSTTPSAVVTETNSSRQVVHGQIVPRRLLTLRPVSFCEPCSFVSAVKMESDSSNCSKNLGENLQSLGDKRWSERYLLSAGGSFLREVKASNSVVAMRRDLGEHNILAGLSFREAGQHVSRQKKSSSREAKFSVGSSSVVRWAPDIRGNDTDPAAVGLSKQQQTQELEISVPLHDGKGQSFLRNSVCRLSSGSSVSPLSAQRDGVIGGGQKASGEGAPEISGGVTVLTTGAAQPSKEQNFTALLQQFISMQQGFQLNKRDADVEVQSPVSMQQQGIRNSKRAPEVEYQVAGKQKFTALLQQCISTQQRPEHKNKDKHEEAQPPRRQTFTSLLGQFVQMQEGVEREKTGADVDLEGAVRHPPRQQKFTSLLQQFIKMEHGVGKKESSAGLDPGGAAEFKQRGLSSGGTGLALISSAAHQWTPETSCVESSQAQAIVAVGSQLSASISPKNFLASGRSTSMNKSTREDAQFCYVATQRREREDVDSNNEHSQSNTCGYSIVSESSDRGCDLGAKYLPWDGVRLSAGVQQTRKDGADGTTLGDQHSSRSSCVSFKELLSSVSQSFALPSGGTISAECSSVETNSRMNRNCGGFISSEVQELQTVNGRKSGACLSGHDSQISDPSYEQGTIIRLNGGTSSETDVDENNHKGRSIAGETPGLGGGTANSCRVQETESTRSGCSDASSSIGKNYAALLPWKDEEGVLSEVVNLLPEIREPAARNVLADESFVLGPTTSSFTPEHSSEHLTLTASDDHRDFDEVEILQPSSLVLREKKEFEEKLKVAQEKPFSTQELLELYRFVSECKPQMRLRESRHETRHVPLEKDGFSYLEHYPEFGRKLELTDRPRDKLKLLRGFFFWVQHTCMSGAYMPWEEEEEDDDCIQIVEEKCTAPRQASSDKPKADGGSSCRSDAVTKGSTHSCSHMSLRARKKIVYTVSIRGKKNVAGHLRTTKVKTEDKTR